MNADSRPVAQHHPEPVDVTPGPPPSCRCDDLHPCLLCGEDICPAHQDEPCSECVEGGWHHDDCARLCLPCDQAAWDDRQTDLADAMRKEPW